MRVVLVVLLCVVLLVSSTGCYFLLHQAAGEPEFRSGREIACAVIGFLCDWLWIIPFIIPGCVLNFVDWEYRESLKEAAERRRTPQRRPYPPPKPRPAPRRGYGF